MNFLILIFGFLPQRSFSSYTLSQKILKEDQSFNHKIFNDKLTLFDSEILNINQKLTSDTPFVIDFNTPHGLIIFKEGYEIICDINFKTNTMLSNNIQKDITNKSITKETAAFFFGNSMGQISIRTNLKSTHFSAVKIIFPENCQRFYLQTKYDNFQVNNEGGKTELISSLSLTEENALTCYYLDMDFVPYFVSFKFNDIDDFVKINGKITNSESNQINFTEKSILTFEDVYFSQKSMSISKSHVKSMTKPQINMTIFSHVPNDDDISIRNIMNKIIYFKGYLQNTPNFIEGEISKNTQDQEYPYDSSDKKKKTTAIIATILCVFVAFILCSIISYCIRKRKYCRFNNIKDNDDRINPNDNEIVENDISSSIGNETTNDIDRNENMSNEGFEDRKYILNEFDEMYPQNNFQQSNIEYKVPSQSLLATVLDEANAKL